MNKKAILVIGTDEKTLLYSLTTVSSNSEWNIVSATAAEDAIEKFHQQDFTAVVFTSGIHEEDKKLRKIFTLQNPGVIILQNEKNDLMLNEIKEAAEKQEKSKRSFSIVDDALKNAMLPITVQ